MWANDDGECRLSDGALKCFGEVNNGLMLGIIKLGKRGDRVWIGEGLRQGMRCNDGCIGGGGFRHRTLVWKKLHCFGGALGSGIRDIKLVASIVFFSRT